MAVCCVLIKWSKTSRFKSFVFNSLWFVIYWDSLFPSTSAKCGLETMKEGLIAKRTARRPGVRQQNVLTPHQVGAESTDFHVARTTKPAMCVRVSETATSLALWRSHKKRVCLVIWPAFVCANSSSYIFLWHENVSGVFRDTILLQGCARASSSCVVRKVVTRMLHRITLVYVICRQIWTKRQVNIWTSVRTQEMQRYRRTKSPFQARRTTSATAVLRSPPLIAGLGGRATWKSVF